MVRRSASSIVLPLPLPVPTCAHYRPVLDGIESGTHHTLDTRVGVVRSVRSREELFASAAYLGQRRNALAFGGHALRLGGDICGLWRQRGLLIEQCPHGTGTEGQSCPIGTKGRVSRARWELKHSNPVPMGYRGKNLRLLPRRNIGRVPLSPL